MPDSPGGLYAGPETDDEVIVVRDPQYSQVSRSREMQQQKRFKQFTAASNPESVLMNNDSKLSNMNDENPVDQQSLQKIIKPKTTIILNANQMRASRFMRPQTTSVIRASGQI